MEKLRKWLPGLLIFAVLLASVAAGAAYGKYIFGKAFTGTVTLNANLGSITLLESKANPNGDGSYTLDKTTPVTGNTYQIIPGLDIPKDPYVTIKNKSSIPVYVFVEVSTNMNESKHFIEYTLTNDWKLLSNNTETGVSVYYYTAGGEHAATVDNTFGTDGTGTIQILQADSNGNSLIVSQKLNAPIAGIYLNFRAFMGQVITTGEAAQTVYERITA